jgi:PAS domain S-box-containing protein
MGRARRTTRSAPTPVAKKLQDPVRLAAVRGTGLLDTPAEAAFDQLGELTRRLLRAPMAQLSLVTHDRQFFKCALGLPEPWQSLRETPLSHSYCSHVVATGEALAVGDSRRSPRFKHNASIRELGIVAYLGVPVRSPGGEVLGALAVMDRKPRRWTAVERRIAVDLAVMAETLIGTIAVAETARRHLSALLATAPDAIITMDAGGIITGWSPRAEEILGWTADEVIGRRMSESVVPRRHREAHERGLAELLLAGAGSVRPRRIATTVLHRSGAELPVEVTISVGRSNDDWRFCAFVRDRGASTHAERIQRAAFRIAHAAANAAGLAELLKEIHGVVAELMPARNFYVALVDAELGRLTFPYYVDEKVAPTAERPMRRGLTEYVLRTGRSQLVTPEVHRQLREAREVEPIGPPAIDWIGVPLRPRDEVIGVLVAQSYAEGVRYGEAEKEILEFVSTQVAMAIERRHAEERLRQSETKYRLLFEDNPEPIWVFDSETLRFLAVNDAAIHRYGWTREEFLAMSILDIRPPADQEEIRKRTRHPLAGPELRTGHRHCRKDGTIFDVEVMVDSTEFEGRPARLAMVRDISERKRLEGQLQQAQRLEAVGRLAGGVAHDFNNLLTAMMGYSDLLMETLAPTDERRDDLEEIRKATRRAAALTHQLLAYSRQQVLQPRIIDLNTVVHNTLRLLHRLIGENIILEPRLESKLGSVLADPAQLEQVIVNLAVNARDAMPGGGRLVIATRNLTLSAADLADRPLVAPGRYVQLTVEDSGTGMNEETAARLFEPFFTTKGPGKGTGLGLATVYGIVQQSGGIIEVKSTPGQGSTFTTLLPYVDAPPEASHATVPPISPPTGSETILLVEDEPALRAIARRALERRGYRVLEASDGEMALALATAHPERIDLLLTDVVMPRLSGREIADALTVSRKDLKVLYMSGYTDDAIVQHGVLDPTLAFLQKPFTPDLLTQKVREVLDAA